jgi:glutathione synthase/RimK-type ligase-like ATP-grasp enzyme
MYAGDERYLLGAGRATDALMVCVVGLDNDKTLAHFLSTAPTGDVDFLNLHDLAGAGWRFPVPATADVTAPCVLDPHDAYYIRIVDLSPVLPEPEASRWRAMTMGITAFLESAPGVVVNRPGGHSHNAAKPLHEIWLARRGFAVPPAISTSDRDEICSFIDRCGGAAIVKSLCGVRGDAQRVTRQSFEDFVEEQGPVHVQRLVEGFDIRVHLIGTTAHAERIVADGIDYRSRDVPSRHAPFAMPQALIDRMVDASRAMDLAFTGWDFKVDADGTFWCLEVNPMPGYDSYDRRADGAISRTLLEYLKSHAAH